jgi:NADPH:quinone reductase-like Zn-dependent oxidoreductase
MRAYAVWSFGEVPAIGDLPLPSADDAYLIRVTYAGVNPIDYKSLDRLTSSSAYPVVVGIDFAGVVERAPAGAPLLPGQRVFGMARKSGSYAEYTAVVPGAGPEPVARIPDAVTDEQAAALPVAALATLGALELLAVSKGQRLVVLGAAGAAGGYAVQIAHSRGAYVIGTVRGDTGEARRLGADEVYDTNELDAIDAIRAAHPDGVDAILDLVNGPEAMRRDADVLKPGGKVVSAIGAADIPWFDRRQIAAHNIGPATNPAVSPRGLDELARMLAEGNLSARIRSVVTLEDAGQALDRLQRGGIDGKIVIRL